MSDLVGNPEGRVYCEAALLMQHQNHDMHENSDMGHYLTLSLNAQKTKQNMNDKYLLILLKNT